MLITPKKRLMQCAGANPFGLVDGPGFYQNDSHSYQNCNSFRKVAKDRFIASGLGNVP